MLREGRSFSGKERNCVFLNTMSSESSNGQFATISAVSGVDFPDDGRAVAQIDWDHDGDLDLWFTNRNGPRLRFLRNEIQSENKSLQLKLTGNGTSTNRNAVGARVVVTTKSGDDATVQQLREIRAGDAFISQGTLTVHFGLGKDQTIEKIEVQWPDRDNTVELFEGIVTDGRFELVQGSGKATPITAPGQSSVLKPSVLRAPALTQKQRIPLLSRFAAPPLTYKTFDGKRALVEPDKNQVTLLNLWSTTCGPCLGELTEFTEQHQRLKEHGIRVVALCIDELDGGLFDPESGDPSKATKAVVDRIGMPFVTGMAGPELVSQIQRLHNSIVESIRPLPLPTSIMIDREGRLDIIYKGTISVEQLIADTRSLSEQSVAARFVRSAMLEGELLNHPSAMELIENAAAQAHIKLARELVQSNKIDEAISEYQVGLKVLKDSAFMQNELATLYTVKGQYKEAIKWFRRAIELEPTKTQFRINLAQSLVSSNQLESAEKEMARLLKDSPDNGEAHFYLGVIQSRQKKPEQARKSFENAVRFDPSNARAHFSLGNQYMQQGNFESARLSFEKALEIEPREVVVLTSLADALLQLDQPVLAETRVLQALEIQPSFANAHYQMGLIHLYRNDRQAARSSFTEALRLQPGHPASTRALNELR